MWMNKTKRKNERAIIYILSLLCIVFTLFPILWAFSMSFKPATEIITATPEMLPKEPTLQNYVNVWTESSFSNYFRNSLLTSSIAVIVIVIMSTLNGFALSRLRFRGRTAFTLMMLVSQMIPMMMVIIPQFIIYKQLHLINKFAGVIISYVVMQLPFNTLLMRGFINSVPKEIDEAAMLDGCNRFQVVVKFIVPAILPGIVATASFAFISAWNDFFISFSFIVDQAKFTIAVGLKYLIGQYSVDYGAIAAGSMIALLPPILLFAYVQRYLVAGLTAGSTKG